MVSLAGLQLEEDMAIADALGTIGGSAPPAADVDNGDTAGSALCPDADDSRPITSIHLQSAFSSKFKRGVPQCFAGKVSPAFDKHILWPSSPKKRKIAAK